VPVGNDCGLNHISIVQSCGGEKWRASKAALIAGYDIVDEPLKYAEPVPKRFTSVSIVAPLLDTIRVNEEESITSPLK
jgi:hypothetical protein